MEKQAGDENSSRETDDKLSMSQSKRSPELEKDLDRDRGCQRAEASSTIEPTYRVTGSRSGTEHEKKGEKCSRSGNHRSKSFIEESSRSKPGASNSKRKLAKENKDSRIVHGSHGDGFSNVNSEIQTTSCDKNQGDREGEKANKTPNQPSEGALQAPVTTQNFFDSPIAISNLVHVTNPNPLDNFSVANTLLATPHAGSVVSSYLNSYRSYLDHLRKSCGREPGFPLPYEPRDPRAAVPLVLPLTRMTPVFSEDSREDPEFLELLRKTTTESIRKLWPHPAKTNIVRRAGLLTPVRKSSSLVSVFLDPVDEQVEYDCETSEGGDLVKQGDDILETFVEEISLGKLQCVQGLEEGVKDIEDELVCRDGNAEGDTSIDPDLIVQHVFGDSAMPSSVVNQMNVGDGGSTTSQSGKMVNSMTKGLGEETMIAGDNSYINALSSQSVPQLPSDWSVSASQANDMKQMSQFQSQAQPQRRQSVIENLVQHQQKLLHQQQLKRQILQHQERQKQAALQKQHLQQQMQQKEQEKFQQQYQLSLQQAQRQQECLEDSDTTKQWYKSSQLTPSSQENQLGMFGSYTNSAVCQGMMGQIGHSATDQRAFTMEDKARQDQMMCAQIGHREGAVFSQQTEFFPSSSGRSISSSSEETPIQARTLKASYACIDPNSPMGLDPVFTMPTRNQATDYLSETRDGQKVAGVQKASYKGIIGERMSPMPDGNRLEMTRTTLGQDKDIYGNSREGLSFDDSIRASSRASPYGQQENLSDFPRLNPRPIVKTNFSDDSSLAFPSYRSAAGMSSLNGSAMSSMQTKPQESWSILSGDSDAFGAGFAQNQASDCFGIGFMAMQSVTDMDQARTSRLHQWRQDPSPTPDLGYCCSTSQGMMTTASTGYVMESQNRNQTFSPFKGTDRGAGAWKTPLNPSPPQMGAAVGSQRTTLSDQRKRILVSSMESQVNSQASLDTMAKCQSWSTTSSENHMSGEALTIPVSSDKGIPLSTASVSQITTLQNQQHQEDNSTTEQRSNNDFDDQVYKLSDDLENTMIGDNTSSLPWHELAVNPDENENDSTFGQGNSYMKMQGFDRGFGSYRPEDYKRNPDLETMQDPDPNGAFAKGGSTAYQRGGQDIQRPRMILGGNSARQMTEDKEKVEMEESNRRLREMLGISNREKEILGQQNAAYRMQESLSLQSQQGLHGMMHPGAGQNTRFQQLPPNKLQASMGMAQQMYCVPNILVPPPPVPQSQSSRAPGMISVPNMMANGGSRFHQGMIRVPFVDMSRLVYVHQVPVNVSGTHTNNNHNNSSSSNPHVNTSNIITINTAENDFSLNGLGDKGSRGMKPNSSKGNKSALLKLRAGAEEFSHPLVSMRPGVDDGVCLRSAKSRPGHWDQDLDHDFSNSLITKNTNLDTMGILAPGTLTPTGDVVYNPEFGYLYQDVASMTASSPTPSTNGLTAGGDQPQDQPQQQQTTKLSSYMHWPVAADAHPEMLDMLPVKRAMPEESVGGAQRYCWPDMEFMMPSSREQLQAARRSNKPMGSNRANLISIVPKGGNDGSETERGKEIPFDKSQL